jgi:hypothetical protein
VRRHERYREFLERDTAQTEIAFIRSAVQRNQLTGDESFITCVEALACERIAPREGRRPRG